MSNSKWDRIIAARVARQQTEEIEVEEISALNLIEAILEERPGNFKTVFEQLMQDRLQDLVVEAKQYLASSLLGEQEVDDEEDEDFVEDDEDNLEEIPDEEEFEDEDQIDETRLINRKNNAGDKAGPPIPKSSLRGRLLRRRHQTNEQHLRGHGTTLPGAPAGGAHLPGPTGPKAYHKNTQPKNLMTKLNLPLRPHGHTDYTNTQPQVQGKKSGNSEKKAHQMETLGRLKKISKDLASKDKV